MPRGKVGNWGMLWEGLGWEESLQGHLQGWMGILCPCTWSRYWVWEQWSHRIRLQFVGSSVESQWSRAGWEPGPLCSSDRGLSNIQQLHIHWGGRAVRDAGDKLGKCRQLNEHKWLMLPLPWLAEGRGGKKCYYKPSKGVSRSNTLHVDNGVSNEEVIQPAYLMESKNMFSSSHFP